MNKGLNNLPKFINLPKPPKRIWDDQETVNAVGKYIIAFDPAAEGGDYSVTNEVSIIKDIMYCQVEETWFTDLNQILVYLDAVSSDDYLKLCVHTSLKKGYNIQPDILYELIYNPDIHDSGPVTLSIHRTKEGAEEAMQSHKDEVKYKFDETYHNSEYPVEMVVDMEWDDNQYWDIKPIKIEE